MDLQEERLHSQFDILVSVLHPMKLEEEQWNLGDNFREPLRHSLPRSLFQIPQALLLLPYPVALRHRWLFLLLSPLSALSKNPCGERREDSELRSERRAGRNSFQDPLLAERLVPSELEEVEAGTCCPKEVSNHLLAQKDRMAHRELLPR